MYKVTVTTHFEDWYDGATDIKDLDTLEEAMNLFCSVRKDGFEWDYHTLDEFIAGWCFDDDEDIDDYTKGFIIWIFNDNHDGIVYQGFEYDSKSHSVEERAKVEFDRELLTQEEIRVLSDLGYIEHPLTK